MEIKRLTKEELQAFARLKGCKIENLYYRGDISLLQKPEKIIALIGGEMQMLMYSEMQIDAGKYWLSLAQ